MKQDSEPHMLQKCASMNSLKAVEKAGLPDADKVMRSVKSGKIDDFFGQGSIREDDRYVHDRYLMQMKSPAKSKGSWDYYKTLKQRPAEQIWTESQCQYWR